MDNKKKELLLKKTNDLINILFEETLSLMNTKGSYESIHNVDCTGFMFETLNKLIFLSKTLKKSDIDYKDITLEEQDKLYERALKCSSTYVELIELHKKNKKET